MMWEYLKQLSILVLLVLLSLWASQRISAQEGIMVPIAQYKTLMQNSIISRDSLKQANQLTESLNLRIQNMQITNEGILKSNEILGNINKELNQSWNLDKKRLEESSAINVEQATRLTTISEYSKKLEQEKESVSNELVMWKILGISGATLGGVALLKLAIDFFTN